MINVLAKHTMWWYGFLMLCVTASSAENDSKWKLVNTAQGPVRGYRETDGVYVFYNIPYATAPTGENKFKAPLPPPQWTEPIDAIDKGVICPQADIGAVIIKTKTMQEDCLIANIYVPDTEEKDLSVILYIHGGAFQIGFGDMRKAKTLMSNKKMIVVTFNYRLGIHGFLCLGTKDAPGNAGMKDMIAMLRWLKKNIASFGGNPDDVTISGYSAGAAAAELLLLSKPAKDLFNKVIVDSGASLASFSIQSDPLENAKSHAQILNFTNVEDVYALEMFYKTASYETLTADSFFTRKDSSFVFVPCVERDIGEEVFLHDSPAKILKKGDYTKVPMLNGITNMEGLMRIPLFDVWKSAMNEKFSDFLPPDLVFESNEQKEEIAKKIKEYYFKDKPVDSDNILGYVDFFTDVTFASPVLRSISLNVEGGNNQIYLYYYWFVDDNDPFVPYTKLRGADHCAQSMAILDDQQPVNSTMSFTNLRKIMRQMWRDFIALGNPLPKGSSIPLVWSPTNAERTPFMSFGPVVEVSGYLLKERGRFWDEIYEKYYRHPIPPPLPANL